MSYRIVKIHLDKSKPEMERSITKIQLSDGTIENVSDVVQYINDELIYYFKTIEGETAVVNVVYPSQKKGYQPPYICTENSRKVLNGHNMMDLPRF
ncbi:DUF3892 domain-containing protein [Fructilactobacillus sp. Tb1]|uniref:DUF3892 domain-containing protein n=1 Tax=Fructilactobacillus sp. Tb1 TaxID=3422304 RepID=UPI003D29E340